MIEKPVQFVTGTLLLFAFFSFLFSVKMSKPIPSVHIAEPTNIAY